MPIERSIRPVGVARITTVARNLLDASTLCAIATVSAGGRAHVNTAYFAWNSELEIVWLSEPHARHSRNVRANPAVAVAVFDSGQTWGKPDRGIQLFGTAEEVAEPLARDAALLYARRFPQYEPGQFAAYRFYRFRSRRLKLFDERELGAGVFVTASLSKGRPAWARTEIYRA